jgi:hypothetical protein
VRYDKPKGDPVHGVALSLRLALVYPVYQSELNSITIINVR